jgi:hypothetical protein
VKYLVSVTSATYLVLPSALVWVRIPEQVQERALPLEAMTAEEVVIATETAVSPTPEAVPIAIITTTVKRNRHASAEKD